MEIFFWFRLLRDSEKNTFQIYMGLSKDIILVNKLSLRLTNNFIFKHVLKQKI